MVLVTGGRVEKNPFFWVNLYFPFFKKNAAGSLVPPGHYLEEKSGVKRRIAQGTYLNDILFLFETIFHNQIITHSSAFAHESYSGNVGRLALQLCRPLEVHVGDALAQHLHEHPLLLRLAVVRQHRLREHHHHHLADQPAPRGACDV